MASMSLTRSALVGSIMVASGLGVVEGGEGGGEAGGSVVGAVEEAKTEDHLDRDTRLSRTSAPRVGGPRLQSS